MGKSRKHRVALDITFSRPLTDGEAVRAAKLVLDGLDLDARPVYATPRHQLYMDKLAVKSARARAAERLR